MGTTFQKCPKAVHELAQEILNEFDCYEDYRHIGLKIDLVFAFKDEKQIGATALKKNGQRALGICRKISLKDRALGRGDVEIALDGDWWNQASEKEQRALLDHEIYHIGLENGKRDDLGRPVVFMRLHDIEVGWFTAVAERHGEHSMERHQAKRIMDARGQYYWPDIADRKSVV